MKIDTEKYEKHYDEVSIEFISRILEVSAKHQEFFNSLGQITQDCFNDLLLNIEEGLVFESKEEERNFCDAFINSNLKGALFNLGNFYLNQMLKIGKAITDSHEIYKSWDDDQEKYEYIFKILRDVFKELGKCEYEVLENGKVVFKELK